ncbi:MAG TPA: hypothetical protein VMF52_14420 [Steroidobacteraceae bacterium]|nr:hypothetical protein [Steroidobacteraceae bacterium]
MNTVNNNLNPAAMTKVVASAVAALMLTMLVSWTFVDATRTAQLTHGSAGFLNVVSALVR